MDVKNLKIKKLNIITKRECTTRESERLLSNCDDDEAKFSFVDRRND